MSSNHTLALNSWEFCCLPASLLEYPPQAQSCPSSSSLLGSLAIFNVFSAAFNLFLGHERTRYAIQRRIPDWLSCIKSSSKVWQPYAAICMTVLQVIGMTASTAMARSTGFSASFGTLLGLWSMRPRMAFLTYFYDQVITDSMIDEAHETDGVRYSHSSFTYTLHDTILSESLLNIFSIYFALNLFQQVGHDGLGCQSNYDHGTPKWFGALNAALAWKIAGGCLSAFVLASHLNAYLRAYKVGDNDERTPAMGIWVYLFSLLAAFVNFITSWEIWAIFVNAAGAAYCPGSVAGTGLTWGFILALNAVMRPLLGGGAV